jgi:hypothetical protein
MLVAKSIRSGELLPVLPAAPAHAAKHVGPSSTLAANSVSRKWMTATLRFDLHHSIAGTLQLDHPHTTVEHRNHVRAVLRPRHYEAPMAPALDQAPLQLVHQRRRLQAARPQVRCTPQNHRENGWNWMFGRCLGCIGYREWHNGGCWDAQGAELTDCLTGLMTCSPRRTTLFTPPSSASSPRRLTIVFSVCAAPSRYMN